MKSVKVLWSSRRILLNLNQMRTSMLAFSSRDTGDIQDMQVQEQIKHNLEAGHMTELVRDFLDPGDFYREIKNIGISFFCGVPDSLLKDFCSYVATNEKQSSHVITANEGNAIGLAAGYHLATGNISLVYLQNSGLGNVVNPLVSLAAPEVYAVPMLLLIGWRGEPGKRDEPQHMVQGEITAGLLDTLGIPYSPLPDYIEGARKTLNKAKEYMEGHSSPYALLVKRQTFLPYKLSKPPAVHPMSREMALKVIVDSLHDRDIVVSTTGMMSRELFEHRVVREQGHERDFLTVGSMGHASTIALGIALNKPKRQGRIAETIDDLRAGIHWLEMTSGPVVLEVRVHQGSRKDLGRPTRSPIQNKADFMNFLSYE
ncbi:hypothetical protein C0J52_21645 [Blattella germanica]|nr:hypothetical protein C0J52_21645 [Blattella germanica]